MSRIVDVVLLSIGLMSMLMASVLIAVDGEHPARRAILWGPRLFGAVIVSLAGLVLLAQLNRDSHYLILYVWGLVGTGSLLVPAGLVHLWRIRRL